MFSFFKSRGGARPLDDYLTRYLTATYQMSADELGKLQFATTKTQLASQNVTTFRIFDPSLANGSAEKLNYSDLDGQADAIQFEGTFASDKTVTEIRDMRKQSS